MLASMGACNSVPETATQWPDITHEMKSGTRWWWLGSDVDSAGLNYNLSALAGAGIGSVEITPIYGVQGRDAHYRDYLSPSWMRMLDYTQTKAHELGMSVDMSNTTGWPFGGPWVSVEDAATKAFFQHYDIKGGNRLAGKIAVETLRQTDVAYLDKLMAYSSAGEKLDLTDRVKDGRLDWTAPAGSDWKLTALFIGKTFQQVKRAAPGAQGLVLDHFNKAAVERYLAYFDRAFAESGTAWPETFFNDSYEVYGADWTGSLLDEFEQRRGYKLQDYFPELLADGATDASVRVISDYRETIGDILLENFTQTWVGWAHNHGIKTRNQAHGSPANLIDLYAAVDIPECETFGVTDFDIPGLRKDSIYKKNDSDPVILKFASSAAHITGRTFTSSETFTWLSEHFRTSLSQAKAEIDQIFTSGINRVFFHGSTYSPEEAAWPGWKFYASVDMSPTNPYWTDAPAFFQYISRVQSFLQNGQPASDFLLYFPMYDIWGTQRGNYFTAFSIHGLRDRLPEFYTAMEGITSNGYDVDYISDRFLTTTTVENGKLKTEGGTIYQALVLPSVRLIPVETLEKIKTLIEQGATVVFADHYPQDVPGWGDLDSRREQLAGLMEAFPAVTDFNGVSQNNMGSGIVITGEDYGEMLARCDAHPERFAAEYGGQLIRRRHDLGHHYFLFQHTNRPVDGWVTLGVSAAEAMIFDPMTGQSGKAALRKQSGQTQVYLQMKPGESLILKTFDKGGLSVADWTYYEPDGTVTTLQQGWTMAFTESEPAVTETCELSALGSWTDLDNEILKRNMGTARYTIQFDFAKSADKEYRLNLGDVRESARVKVNGQEAGTLYAVPYERNIGNLLKDGENTIEVEVTNLPANRIADYDRRGVDWRIFNEINFVSITYQPTKFDIWGVVPSGLLGPVTIEELKPLKP